MERFELLQARDRWGFGRCHDATDHVQRRRVVLKTLPTVVESGAARALWDELGPHLTRLGGTQVVSALECGWWQGQAFLAMDPMEGVTLGQWIGQHRATRSWTSLDAARSILADVCRGVSLAHRLRTPGPLVHGYLTPESVVIDVTVKGPPHVAVQDFGLARLPGATSGLGERGAWLDPRSAEQCADPAAAGVGGDVFALGVLAVQVLAPHAVEVLRRSFGELEGREAELRALLASLRGDVDDTVWDVIGHALHRDPRQRLPDVERFASMLRKARWEPAGAPRPMPALVAERAAPEEARVAALPSALAADVGPLPMHMRASEPAAAPVVREATLVDVVVPRRHEDTVVDGKRPRARDATQVALAPAYAAGTRGEPWAEGDGAATVRLGQQRSSVAPEVIAPAVSDAAMTLPLGARVATDPATDPATAAVVSDAAMTLPLGARVAKKAERGVESARPIAPRAPTLGPQDVAGDDWVGATDEPATLSATLPMGASVPPGAIAPAAPRASGVLRASGAPRAPVRGEAQGQARSPVVVAMVVLAVVLAAFAIGALAARVLSG